MTEMSLLFRQMMRTLREARRAVQAEMDLHASAVPPDPASLMHLQKSAEEFGDQAASLASVMRDRQAESALVIEAQELASYFQETERQILALLGQAEAEKSQP
jgi:hypothetical protein